MAVRFGDRRPVATFLTIGCSTTLVVLVLVLIPAAHIAEAVIPLILLLGLTGRGATAGDPRASTRYLTMKRDRLL